MFKIGSISQRLQKKTRFEFCIRFEHLKVHELLIWGLLLTSLPILDHSVLKIHLR